MDDRRSLIGGIGILIALFMVVVAIFIESSERPPSKKESKRVNLETDAIFKVVEAHQRIGNNTHSDWDYWGTEVGFSMIGNFSTRLYRLIKGSPEDKKLYSKWYDYYVSYGEINGVGYIAIGTHPEVVYLMEYYMDEDKWKSLEYAYNEGRIDWHPQMLIDKEYVKIFENDPSKEWESYTNIKLKSYHYDDEEFTISFDIRFPNRLNTEVEEFQTVYYRVGDWLDRRYTRNSDEWLRWQKYAKRKDLMDEEN